MASIAPPFVPAWKRLGLKLKDNSSTIASLSTEPSLSTSHLPKRTKRKVDAVTNDHQDLTSTTPSLKRKKSVSFSTETTTLDRQIVQETHETAPTEAASVRTPQHQPTNQNLSTPDSRPSTKERKPRKRELEARSEETQRYISYLQQFHTAREQWHFNKGRQTALLKNIFNIFRVSSEHDDALATYLSGLQGQAARERLIQTAKDILESTQIAVDSSDNATMSSNTLREPRDTALKKHLKDAKGRFRDQAAQEDSTSDDHLLLLRKRKRAELVLQGLSATQPSMATKLTAAEQKLEHVTKKKRTRRPNKARTGVPDDDLSDDTSSVSSVPSSTGSDDESSSDKESGSSSSEEESDSSSSDDGDSGNDIASKEDSDEDGNESG
jgi:hypothetical protein